MKNDLVRYGKHAEKVELIFKKILAANPFKGVRFKGELVIGVSQLENEEPNLVTAGARFIPLSEVNPKDMNK